MDFSDSSLYSHVLIGVITSDLLQKTKHVRIFTQSQSPKRPGPLPLGLLQRQNHEGHCQHSSLPQRVLGKGYPFVRFGNIRAVELDIQSLSLLLMVQQSHPLRWPVLPLFLEGFIHPRWFVPHFVQHCQYQLPSSTPNDPSNYPLVHQHINGESSCSVRFNKKYIFIISFTVHVPDMTIYSEEHRVFRKVKAFKSGSLTWEPAYQPPQRPWVE